MSVCSIRPSGTDNDQSPSSQILKLEEEADQVPLANEGEELGSLRKILDDQTKIIGIFLKKFQDLDKKNVSYRQENATLKEENAMLRDRVQKCEQRLEQLGEGFLAATEMLSTFKKEIAELKKGARLASIQARHAYKTSTETKASVSAASQKAEDAKKEACSAKEDATHAVRVAHSTATSTCESDRKAEAARTAALNAGQVAKQAIDMANDAKLKANLALLQAQQVTKVVHQATAAISVVDQRVAHAAAGAASAAQAAFDVHHKAETALRQSEYASSTAARTATRTDSNMQHLYANIKVAVENSEIAIQKVEEQQQQLEQKIEELFSNIDIAAAEEMKDIRSDPKLFLYYTTHVKLVVGTYYACLSIITDLVRSNEKFLSDRMASVIKQVGYVPGINFITAAIQEIIQSWNNDRKVDNANCFLASFPDPGTAIQEICKIVRSYTFSRSNIVIPENDELSIQRLAIRDFREVLTEILDHASVSAPRYRVSLEASRKSTESTCVLL